MPNSVMKSQIKYFLDGTEKVQRKAARHVMGKVNKFRTAVEDKHGNLVFESVSEMVRDLAWVSLAVRRGHQRLSIVHKALAGDQGLADIAQRLHEAEKKSGRLDHERKLMYERTGKDVGLFGLIARTTREWNLLPASVFEGGTLPSFKENLKSLPSLKMLDKIGVVVVPQI